MLFEFFLVVTPGLEELALQELVLKKALLQRRITSSPFALDFSDIEKSKGGIAFKSETLEAGLSLNYLLKIPTRILLRVAEFKSTDFSDLYKKIMKQRWNRYLRQAPEVTVKVTSSSSRLKIKDRIESCVREALRDSQKRIPLRKPLHTLSQTLLVRIENDQVELSIDTSGDPLYKRGHEKWTEDAPIRETLASALYFKLFQKMNPSEGESLSLYDPLCGSGTLLFEANNFFTLNRARSFAFQNFPSFKGIGFSGWPTHLFEAIIKVSGSDISEKAIGTALKNAEKLAIDISLQEVALEDLNLEALPDKTWLLANPPYDYRIAADMKKISDGFERIFQSQKVDVMALVWPKSHWSIRPLKNEINETILLKNGGIEVAFLFYYK